ncbi:hypothetical protein ABPG74_014422 [Tetrahymena malaccensis]
MYNLLSNSQQDIKCSIHPKQNVQFALLKKKNSNQAFYCSLCLLQNNIERKYLISIDDAINQPVTQPIFNWPLGINQNIYKYLQDCSTNNKKEQIKQKIEEYYEDLEQKIVSQLKESKKQALNDLEISPALNCDLINIYNYEFKRSELKDLLNSNTQYVDDEYWNLLNKIDESKDKAFNELEQKIKSIDYIQNQLEKGTPKLVKQLLNFLTQQINFFDVSPNPQENSKQYNNQQRDNINNKNKLIQAIFGIFERLKLELKNKSQIEQNLQERNKEYLQIKKQIENIIYELQTNKKTELNKLINLENQLDLILQQLLSFSIMRIEEFDILEYSNHTQKLKIIKNMYDHYQKLNLVQQDRIQHMLNNTKNRNIFEEILSQNVINMFVKCQQTDNNDQQKLSSNKKRVNFNQHEYLKNNLNLIDISQQAQTNQWLFSDKSSQISNEDQYQKNDSNLLAKSQQTHINQKQVLSLEKTILISNQNQSQKSDSDLLVDLKQTEACQKQANSSTSFLSN